MPGKSGKATFIVVKKEQSTLFQDIVVEGGGVSIKGSLEVDQNGDLLNANFPTYAPSDGDKASLKVERSQDGVVKGTGLGSKLVNAMAATLKSTVDYDPRHKGVRATLLAAA